MYLCGLAALHDPIHLTLLLTKPTELLTHELQCLYLVLSSTAVVIAAHDRTPVIEDLLVFVLLLLSLSLLFLLDGLLLQ